MSRQLFQTTSVLVTLILSLASTGQIHAQTRSAQNKPNILFALADDWSYGHAGAYGCKWVKTPAFDRVASEGLLFNNAYTPDVYHHRAQSLATQGRRQSLVLFSAGNKVISRGDGRARLLHRHDGQGLGAGRRDEHGRSLARNGREALRKS